MKTLVIILLIGLARAQGPQLATTGCPVEDDPSQLARCIQIDVTAIVEAIKGSRDYTSFCALANRYMECFATYTRGCPGQYVKIDNRLYL